MGNNFDLGGMDVFVRLNEMGSDDCSKELGRGDRMLLGHDVDGVLHGICRYNDAVVGFCVSIPFQLGLVCNISRYVRGLDVSLKKHAYCHLHYRLDPCLCILMDFVDPDVVLPILGCRNLRHDSFWTAIKGDKKDVWVFGQLWKLCDCFCFFAFFLLAFPTPL